MNKFEFDRSEFMGVFFFTNWTDEDFVHLWNNEEYVFKSLTSSPMIMPRETSEAVQEIRKRFAYDLAVREWFKSKEYKRLSKMGNGLPPIYDEKILEPMIEKCLNPLPITKARVRKVESRDIETRIKSSKAIGEKDNPNYVFKDENLPEKIEKLGVMSNKVDLG